MKSIVATLFLTLLLLPGLSAQISKDTLKGYVSESMNKEPVSFASILILSTIDSSIIEFAISDEYGKFHIAVPRQRTDKTLVVQYIGYAPFAIALDSVDVLDELMIEIKPEAMDLKEVIVTDSPPLRKLDDTLVYDVSSFSDSSEMNLGEVLAKMPGFEVTDEGTVIFQGRRIDRLFVEGDDLTGARYEVLIRKLNPEFISKVEVFEFNNIPIIGEVLYAESMAINLKLSEEAKKSLAVSGDLGIGSMKKYSATLNVFALGSKVKQLHLGDLTNVSKGSVSTRGNFSSNSLLNYWLPFQSGFDELTGFRLLRQPVGLATGWFNREYSGSFKCNFSNSWALTAAGQFKYAGQSLEQSTFYDYTGENIPDRFDQLAENRELKDSGISARVERLVAADSYLRLSWEHIRLSGQTGSRLSNFNEIRTGSASSMGNLLGASFVKKLNKGSALVLESEYNEVGPKRTFGFFLDTVLSDSNLTQAFNNLAQKTSIQSRDLRMNANLVQKIGDIPVIIGLSHVERKQNLLDWFQLSSGFLSSDSLRELSSMQQGNSLNAISLVRVGKIKLNFNFQLSSEWHQIFGTSQNEKLFDNRDLILNTYLGAEALMGDNSKATFSAYLGSDRNSLLQSRPYTVLSDRFTLEQRPASLFLNNVFRVSGGISSTRQFPYTMFYFDFSFLRRHSPFTAARSSSEQFILNWLKARPVAVQTYSGSLGWDKLILKVPGTFKLRGKAYLSNGDFFYNANLLSYTSRNLTVETSFRTGFSGPVNFHFGIVENVSFLRYKEGIRSSFSFLQTNPFLDISYKPVRNISLLLNGNYLIIEQNHQVEQRYFLANLTARYKPPKMRMRFELRINNLFNTEQMVYFTEYEYLRITSYQRILGRYVLAVVHFTF